MCELWEEEAAGCEAGSRFEDWSGEGDEGGCGEGCWGHCGEYVVPLVVGLVRGGL